MIGEKVGSKLILGKVILGVIDGFSIISGKAKLGLIVVCISGIFIYGIVIGMFKAGFISGNFISGIIIYGMLIKGFIVML